MIYLKDGKAKKKNYCYFCGAFVSVKYFTDIVDLTGETVKVPCCNKCALNFLGN